MLPHETSRGLAQPVSVHGSGTEEGCFLLDRYRGGEECVPSCHASLAICSASDGSWRYRSPPCSPFRSRSPRAERRVVRVRSSSPLVATSPARWLTETHAAPSCTVRARSCHTASG